MQSAILGAPTLAPHHRDALCFGAGLLCFSRHPASGEIHFLLALEASKTGATSGGYTQRRGLVGDLGGWSTERESPEECACREAAEESAGVVVVQPRDLHRGDYVFRLELDLNYGNPKRKCAKRFITFVKELPWISGVTQKFRERVSAMAAVNASADTLQRLLLGRAHARRARAASPEWHTVTPRARRARRKQDDKRPPAECGQTVRVVHFKSARDSVTLYRINYDAALGRFFGIRPGGCHTPVRFGVCLLSRVRSNRSGEPLYVYQSAAQPAVMARVSPADVAFADALADLFAAYHRLRALTGSACPAGSVAGVVPRVAASHFEKTSLFYWPLARLRKAVLGGGGECRKLRSSFVPSATAVLAQIEELQAVESGGAQTNATSSTYLITCSNKNPRWRPKCHPDADTGASAVAQQD